LHRMSAMTKTRTNEQPAVTEEDPRRRFLPSVSVRTRVIAGFGILVLILASVTIGAAIQVRHHQSDLARLEEHSTMASLLQTAEAQASIAAELEQRYVYTGDGVYVNEINDHANAAQTALNSALARGGPDGLDQIVVAGAQLEQGAAQAVTLKQGGQTDEAFAVLEQDVPIFRQYRVQLEGLASGELTQVEDLRDSADHAGQLAFWLLVASGTIGVVTGIAVSFWIARSIIRPLASLERTARSASEGDLAARAKTTGPREFSHLGSVLNDMMAAIEESTADLRQANRKLRAQNRELTDARMQASTDPLTGLGNHRSFHKTLQDETAAALTAGRPIGLVIIDLDGFKDINDSLGHLAGDQMLRDVAVALARVIDREQIFRYGGDELAVILSGAGHDETVGTAQQLQGALLGVSTQNHGITASFGVACLPESARTAEELVYRADMAMYWAKSAGKNRVSSWNDVSGVDGAAARYVNDRRRPADVITSLRMALAAKDETSRARSELCAALAGDLATALGLCDEDIAGIRLAALLRDVGMLATPDAILENPGPLADAEMELVKRHPVDGANMLSHSAATSLVIEGVRHHHERYDGAGYPDGLAGEMIPVAARIIALVDAYVSMTSDRPYRVAMDRRDAISELGRCRGTQFDPRIVDAFFHILRWTGGSKPATAETSRAQTNAAA